LLTDKDQQVHFVGCALREKSAVYDTFQMYGEMYYYEVAGARPRGRPKKTWREIVEKDYKARGLNREDGSHGS